MSKAHAIATNTRNNLKEKYEEMKIFYEKLVDEVLFILKDCIKEKD